MQLQQTKCRTLSNFKASSRTPKSTKSNLPTIDTAFLSFYDYERIKKNAIIVTKIENQKNDRISSEQKYNQLAKARALKEKIQNYDKKRPKMFLSDIEKENLINNRKILERAQEMLDNNEDVVKEMEKLSFYAKVATIRDQQKKEHKIMEQDHKRKEEKLDIMMELDRLKELKSQQEKDQFRAKQNRDGCMVIIDQMKQKELDRIKQNEQKKKEQEEIMKYIKKMQEEDEKQQEKKKIFKEQMAKEIVEINKINILNKQKKIEQEREQDLKILKYNMEKAKKEEELLQEKKRIQEEKEKEVQKLREKQERAQDKQAELDALRAKRAFEANEKNERIKEKNELIKKKKMLEELIESNNRQKIQKKNQLAEQAKNEQVEYERIIKQQIEEMEREKKIEEEKKKIRYDHCNDLRKLIKLREEKEKVERKEVLEEGRKIRQKNDKWREKMERIKNQKIQELKSLNVKPIYIADLERYKII